MSSCEHVKLPETCAGKTAAKTEARVSNEH